MTRPLLIDFAFMVSIAIQSGEEWADSIAQTFREFVRRSRPQRIRTFREFALEEFIIPKGKYKGRRLKIDRAPWVGAWLDEVDSGRWTEFVGTGNVQSGKTLFFVVLPALYYLLERGEDVICGLPTIKMAADKWRKEFLPAIEANPRFARMLPTRGASSRGGGLGQECAITFTNGATLKFMSGKGNDEERSAYTARVVVITEADRMDESGEVSREGTQIQQLKARTESYGFDARIFIECTVTTETGYVWDNWQNDSSGGRLYIDCPNCGEPISPERDDFIGHEAVNLENAKQAGEQSAFFCSSCGASMTDAQRADACRSSTRLVHQGQTAERGGGVSGEPIPTRVCGFRWSGFHNLFWSSAFMGEKEYRGRRSSDSENSEKALRQWTWALPAEPDEFIVNPITIDDIVESAGEDARGVVPVGTTRISGGVDLRGTELHYVLIAWRKVNRETVGRAFDVGTIPIDGSSTLRVKLLRALNVYRDRVARRAWRDKAGQSYAVDITVIDAGWKTPVVRAFIRANPKGFVMAFGRGQSRPQGERGAYNHPAKIGGPIKYIGENFYVRYNEKYKTHAIFANSDEWKSFVSEGFAADGGDGSLEVFNPTTIEDRRLLNDFARQNAAEQPTQRAVKGRGFVVVWVNSTGRRNHFGDATYNAAVGG
ncbi:MAG: terminase gpA endonuclease subunit [Planctomycetota bacterium]